jgi:hypothetical protein
MIKDEFSAYLETQMTEEDDFDIMVSVSEDCFGAFDDMFSSNSFNETMDNLFPCGVKDEYINIIFDNE